MKSKFPLLKSGKRPIQIYKEKIWWSNHSSLMETVDDERIVKIYDIGVYESYDEGFFEDIQRTNYYEFSLIHRVLKYGKIVLIGNIDDFAWNPKEKN